VSSQQLHVAERSATYEVLKRIETGQWLKVPLTEAIELNPKADRRLLADDTEVSFVPMAAIEAGSGQVDTSTVRPYAEVKKGYTHFRNGDVLFAKITPCMENGKMAVARNLRNGIGFGSTEFHVLRPRDGVDPYYVYHFVSSRSYRSEAAHHMTGAVGQKRVPLAFLEQSQIPLPEFSEQRRIVAEIEKQFSRLDEAVAGIQRVKANIKRYKAAVLKAAVEGRLVPTEADLARREGRGYETGAQLLPCILEARRSQSQSKGKYKEPAAPDTTNLPDLPEGWTWASVNQLVANLTDGDHQPPPQTEFGIPFLVIGNVRRGKVDFTDTRFVGENYYASLDASRRPQRGDLLYTLVGTYGIAVPVETNEQFCIQRHMAILRPHGQTPMEYLTIAMSSGFVFRQATAVATGTAQLTVPLAGLRNIAIPLPPLAEQHRIVAEVDRLLSIAREVEAEVENNLKHSQALRQSVLISAFQQGQPNA